MTTIKLKNGSGAPSAGNLVQGEPALDLTNKRLYTENSSGTVIEVGTNPGENVTFADNRKAIFGAGSDLQIYHDGTSSIIQDAGTGNLIIQATELQITNANNTANYIRAFDGGAVDLRYAGSAKLATTSTGIDVTGDVDASANYKVNGTLLVDSSMNLQNLNIVQVATGSSTAPSIRFTGDTNTGFARPSADTLGFITGGSEAMRISGGNVGIGNSSPSSFNQVGADTLVVGSGSGEQGITIYSGTSNNGVLAFADGTTTTQQYQGYIGYNHSSNFMRFFTDATERMRIDSSGNVGIGTSSPFFTTSGRTSLSVNGSTSSILAFGKGGSSENYILADAGGLTIANTSTTLPTVFFNNGAEAMRLDSAGNLLVGKTSLDVSTQGIVLRGGTGESYFSRTNDNPVYINRNTSDGDLVSFRKNGSTVGSVGSALGDSSVSTLFIADAGNVGIRFDQASTDDIQPCTSAGANRDAAINLGAAGNRFKDLYLSGTARANTFETSTASGGNINIIRDDPTIGTNNSLGAIYWKSTEDSGTTVNTGAAIIALAEQNHSTVASGSYLVFQTTAVGATSSTERLRIDSSGSALVGTTVNDGQSIGAGSQDGIVLAGESQYIQRGDNANLWLSKPSGATNSEFIKFYDNSSAVGSIGTEGSDLTIGTGDTGLQFRDASDAIRPFNISTNAARDASIDLGRSSERFRDLYLSGSVIADGSILSTTGSAAAAAIRPNNDINCGIFFPAANTFAVTTDGSEAYRVDSFGNLLVGTTSSHGKLAIGDFSATGADYGVAFVDGSDVYFVRSSTTIPTSSAHYQFYNTNGNVGSITTNGSATAYNTSSDQRLKDNIVDAPSASDDIDAIQVRSFDWKADGSHQKYGMVAQELNTVVPEAVLAPEDPEEMMGVDYSKLVPMILKEIQSLRARVAQLEGAN